ncbi:MAG: metallophosphoesterase [Flavobacteriaceae bacterium]
MTLTPEEQQAAQQYAAEIKKQLEANSWIGDKIQEILDFLPFAEYALIEYMVLKNAWGNHPIPPPPKDYVKGQGVIEFGLFLYWFKNPWELDLSQFSGTQKAYLIGLVLAMDYYLPPSKLDLSHFEYFKTNELIYVDGTVLSTKPFANFDQGWFTAFLNLFITVKDTLWYNGGTFPTTSPPVIPLQGKAPNTVSIAILGDWGAGNPAAMAVMDQIQQVIKPDYIIHVGDTYYGGTPALNSPTGDKYFAPGEELANLVNLWPSAWNGKSFTLNSNHEMYSGANGLYYDALLNPKSPFTAQKGSGCFALKLGDWTLVGLDSAYNSSSFSAFMTGSIGEKGGFQTQWLQSLQLDPKKTIVFTHHNGFEDDTTSASPLWAEIHYALKGDPFAWYWGHVHNGIVYTQPITIPNTKMVPGFTTATYARCLGHAALPYGLATSLEQPPAKNNITYKADSPQPFPSKQLYNGFAVLTLTTSHGKVSGISEAFYDPSSNTAKYTKRLL